MNGKDEAHMWKAIESGEFDDEMLKKLLSSLPSFNVEILKALVQLGKQIVSHSKVNFMDQNALSVVFAGTVIEYGSTDLALITLLSKTGPIWFSHLMRVAA